MNREPPDREPQKDEDVLAGVVEQVIYLNEENGYAVFRLKTDERTVVVVGNVPFIGPGEGLSARGVWIRHPSYGEQFKASACDRTMPAGEVAILEYLSSGAVSGIGPATAKRIVETFKEETFDVLERHPDRLAGIHGITKAKAEKICGSFSRQLGIRRLMEYLIRYGVSPHAAIRLYRWYGNEAINFLRDNPYLLVDEQFGVEFHLCDNMAAELGFSGDSPVRVDAGILYELEHNRTNGHVFIPFGKLAAATAMLLQIDEVHCTEAIRRLVERGKLFREDIAGEDACYLLRLYEAEHDLARRLRDLAAAPPRENQAIDEAIRRVRGEQGIEYADLQLESIVMAVSHRIFLLTGGPGTGKSTSVRGMLAVFDRMEMKSVLCSPTGRAAKRLGELAGREATTIHRLLEVDFSTDGPGFQFVHDEDEPIDADVIVLDETSMVDLELMNAVVKAMKPEARLVLVGDPDQLPSVGPGNVLKDLLTSGMIASVRLTEVFRQAQGSNIVLAAHEVNRGNPPFLKNKTGDFFFVQRMDPQSTAETVVDLCIRRLPQNMGFSPDQIQVLSPTRRGVAGTANLNALLQEALNPPAPGRSERRAGEYLFRTGDRVMHIRNNYDLHWQSPDGSERGLGVFNGDVGVIGEIDLRAETLMVRYDDRIVYYPFDLLGELEPAYAMTVHKSQGSEYPAVVFVASQAAPQLLNRSVFYTAITRAQSLLVIVGEEGIVSTMVRNNRRSKRYSGLKYRLSQ